MCGNCTVTVTVTIIDCYTNKLYYKVIKMIPHCDATASAQSAQGYWGVLHI